MFITDNFFEKVDCCSSIIKFLNEKHRTNEIIIGNKNYLSWFNNKLIYLMTYEQCIQYTLFAAELVLPIFENEYPDNNRPRKCIEATKMIDDPSKENKKSAYSVFSTVSSADIGVEDAAFVSASARLATYAAYAYSYKSNNNNNTIYDSYCFVTSASVRAASAAKVANNKQIIEYGLKLLEGI